MESINVDKVIDEVVANLTLANLTTIDARQAAMNAEQYLKSSVINVTNILLEESKLTDDEQFWFITLSYNELFTGRIMLSKIFKVFKIRRDNGEVIAMEIRKV